VHPPLLALRRFLPRGALRQLGTTPRPPNLRRQSQALAIYAANSDTSAQIAPVREPRLEAQNGHIHLWLHTSVSHKDPRSPKLLPTMLFICSYTRRRTNHKKGTDRCGRPRPSRAERGPTPGQRNACPGRVSCMDRPRREASA